MPRGGKRAGAGRPATGAKQVASFTLSDEAQAKLEKVAKRHGTSKSAAVESLINKEFSTMPKTLIEYLTGSLSYDSSWGIYAEKIDGEFKPESPARFGQKVFDNGGMLDDCELVGLNDCITDQRDNYCGTDDDAEDFYEEWAEQFIQEINEAS